MILLTGSTGFLGKHLAKSLSEEGYKIRCLIRKKSKIRDIKYLKYLNTELIIGDLTNQEDMIKATIGIKTIIHLAGKLSNKNNDKSYHMINVIGTNNLVNASIKNKVKKILFISTAGIYGPCKKANETTTPNPKNLYEITKLEAEKVILNSGINYNIIRPGIVFGPYDRRFSSIFKLRNFRIVPLFGEGDNIIQPLYVKDFCTIIIKILNLKKNNLIINVAGNIEIRFKSFIGLISNKKTIFLILPKLIINPFTKVNDMIEKYLDIKTILNSKRYNIITESRTYDISLLKKIINPDFTDLYHSIRETKDTL